MSVKTDWLKQQDKTTVEEKLAVAIAENFAIKNKLNKANEIILFIARKLSEADRCTDYKIQILHGSILHQEINEYLNNQQDL